MTSGPSIDHLPLAFLPVPSNIIKGSSTQSREVAQISQSGTAVTLNEIDRFDINPNWTDLQLILELPGRPRC